MIKNNWNMTIHYLTKKFVTIKKVNCHILIFWKLSPKEIKILSNKITCIVCSITKLKSKTLNQKIN